MPRHTVPPPTKEIFIPVTKAVDLNVMGNHVGAKIDGSGDNGYIELRVPWDFHSIVNIDIVFIAIATQSGVNLDVATNYAASGEDYNIHFESITYAGVNTTANQISTKDISTLVDSGPLAAGDQLGVKVTYSSLATQLQLFLLGVRLRYT